MKQHILVTGVNGFVGHHLVRELVDNGIEVTGIGMNPEATPENAAILDHYIDCDLTNQQAVSLLEIGHYDAIIHLAGLANVGMSFAEPAEFVASNATMTIHLLQHAMKTNARARVVAISSGAVYESNQPMPISEDGILSHKSPYAVSKLTCEMMCDYYRSRGMDVVSTRPFNHIGPNQGQGFIVPDLHAKLLKHKQTGAPISVGDLTNARDYTDVRDVVRAYRLLATATSQPHKAVYNVCSGISRTGEEIFSALAGALGVADATYSVDQGLLRPNDAKDIRGDYSTIKDELGWEPIYSFEQTIKDIVA